MFQINLKQQQIENERVRYQYGHGYLHNGDGLSIEQFVDLSTHKNYAYGFDGQYKDKWDDSNAEILNISVTETYVDVEIRTGLVHKIVGLGDWRPTQNRIPTAFAMWFGTVGY